jgi:Putative peptidoglycan binding domain
VRAELTADELVRSRNPDCFLHLRHGFERFQARRYVAHANHANHYAFFAIDGMNFISEIAYTLANRFDLFSACVPLHRNNHQSLSASKCSNPAALEVASSGYFLSKPEFSETHNPVVTLVCRMKWVLLLGLLGTATVSLSAFSQTSTTSKKKSAAKPVSSKSASSKSGARVATASTSKTHKATHGRSRPRRAPVPSYQLHPDPERYQQIQQALADRGYFKGEVNGEWGDDSVDAMKRFQTDQKIDPDGKINALTLIGLGLGPKHDASVAAAGSAPHPAADPSHPAPELPPAPSESSAPPK